jgi:hypothetical protein
LATSSVHADRVDFIVNDDGGFAEQNHPRIAVAGDGGFVIAWVDKRAGSSDIFIQRYLADGTKLGSNKAVNDDIGYAYQSEPAVAVDLSGLYSVVWKDYRQSSYPFDPDIFFQRYDTSLSAIDSNRAVTVEQPDSLKETPDIALSPWGGGVVVWADYRNRNWDIYGQLIDSDGSPTGSNFLVNDDSSTGQQHTPRVAVSSEGWFVVVWYDNRRGHDDIFAQRFDSLAQPLGINVRVNSDLEDDRQAFPDVATDGAGHFTVVWVDWRNGVYPTNPDIYARKFDTTMTPVTDDELVNQDNTRRAQREPTISADRRGNVSIIWSDSSGTAQSYDIVGQMIDVDGVIREVNFQANSEADSAQLHADVALDGRYRYITWADKRNGNYDIYASITRYNDPTLVSSPTSLRFEMLRGGGAPAAQQLTIDNYGYNPLDFTLLASHDWFEATPSGGRTSATVDISITTDTLPFGTYVGALTLHDTDNNDSTVQVSVRLDVTAPILDVGSDTLSFLVYSGLVDSSNQSLTISNAGSGDLNWSIDNPFDWLTMAPVAGTNNATLDVWVNGLTLPSGSTLGYFEIEAPLAADAPDTVWVNVEAVDNQPYIELSPTSLLVVTENPAGESFSIRVTNSGAGQLAWTADPADTWLVLDRSAGIDDDLIGLTFDTSGLALGLHPSHIDIADAGAFHPVERFEITLDYLLPGSDTVTISNIVSEPLALDSFLVQIQLTDTAAELHLPLTYDPDLITIDSVRFSDGVANSLACDYNADPARGVVTLSLTGSSPDSLMLPGGTPLGWVYFTAGSNYGLFDVGEPSESDLAAVVVSPSGGRSHPVTIPGEVRVEEATAVDDLSLALLPAEFSLSQNYPNPFNPQTTIEFGLPIRADVELEIFNILGQKIRTLVQGSLPAGEHNVVWDGKLTSGRPTASGIYFYRLRTDKLSLVRKMALVK